MATFDETAKRRIRFLTRRGLLELDIVLGRFMEKEFDNLSDEELSVFVEILELPDPSFLALVNEKEETDNPEFKSLLDKIRRC
ncbi:MAG: succinate dehydrogenase assembly factor 2 [Neisseria sp.]|uniref:FAD assembly factor SdhE n=1 Tax=Neisseria sp. TaxID=192066 RepID=UPI0026DC90BF|nr:succinate dehydrogenase assembly factor 2 [Neisseria sp.]MDO4248780.1 succinate dehydrogenase assembly factor 2 [Neisseria sp.]